MQPGTGLKRSTASQVRLNSAHSLLLRSPWASACLSGWQCTVAVSECSACPASPHNIGSFVLPLTLLYGEAACVGLFTADSLIQPDLRFDSGVTTGLWNGRSL